MVNKNEAEVAKNRFWNRVQLIMILLVFAAPIVGAFVYKPSKFNNYGDLFVPARQLSNLAVTTLDGQVYELDSLRRQWVFLVLASGDCTQECEDNILKMRQLRFMQNDDMKRIRTVFLHSGLPKEVAEDLHAKYFPIESYYAERADFDRWIKQLRIENAPDAAQKNRFYIIDPAGNLMISYPAVGEPNLMKKDIKRLLKASQIG